MCDEKERAREDGSNINEPSSQRRTRNRRVPSSSTYTPSPTPRSIQIPIPPHHPMHGLETTQRSLLLHHHHHRHVPTRAPDLLRTTRELYLELDGFGDGEDSSWILDLVEFAAEGTRVFGTFLHAVDAEGFEEVSGGDSSCSTTFGGVEGVGGGFEGEEVGEPGAFGGVGGGWRGGVNAGGEVEGDGCRKGKRRKRESVCRRRRRTKPKGEIKRKENGRKDSRFLPFAFLGVFEFVLIGATGIGLDLWFDVVASPRGALICCCCW